MQRPYTISFGASARRVEWRASCVCEPNDFQEWLLDAGTGITPAFSRYNYGFFRPGIRLTAEFKGFPPYTVMMRYGDQD